jgi:hypothetical protein
MPPTPAPNPAQTEQDYVHTFLKGMGVTTLANYWIGYTLASGCAPCISHALPHSTPLRCESLLRRGCAPTLHLQFNNLWWAADGTGNVGNGAATPNTTTTSYAHWGQANVDTMKDNPTFTCARATSTGAYTYFWGNPSSYADLKNTTLFYSLAASDNFAWLATSCTGTYEHICQIPPSSFACPPTPPPSGAPPMPTYNGPLCGWPRPLAVPGQS